MNCQPYIKASLVDKGYEPNTISLDTIERKALRTERAFAENAKDPNILLALNPTLAASYSQQPNRPPRREFKANRSAPSHRTPILHANAISELSNDTRSKDHFKRGTNGAHSRTPPRRPYPPKKSAETLKRLRDSNKCFECEETGHLAKDCPKRHRLPFKLPRASASSLRANAVGVSSAEIRTAAIEEGIASGLYGMAVITPELSELDTAKRLVLAH
jgi:hypothetical protein